MTPPHLLFLCQTLPYPPDGGVWIRTYHVLRLLSRTFEITALCFERVGSASGRGAAQVAASTAALQRFGAVEVFRVPQARSRLRLVWDHARSVASGRPYTRFQYTSRAFVRRVAAVMRERRVDLVHLDSLADLAHFLPLVAPVPTIGVHHNIESRLLARRARTEGRLRGRYLAYQGLLLESWERAWAPRVTLNVCTSDADASELRRLAPGAATTVVPNGVDVSEFSPETGAERGLVFVGGTSWFPNLDALIHFGRDIQPHLADLGSLGHPVRWVGQATPQQQRRYLEEFGIELTGYVDDVRPFMRDAACFVVPLRSGGGTRLKILNAWAMGKAVVTTTIGCEGLAAVHGENALIADDPAAFAGAVRDVLRNPDLRHRLGRNGRETAERLYSWDVLGRDMCARYLEVAGGV